jgi:hypothetical protein
MSSDLHQMQKNVCWYADVKTLAETVSRPNVLERTSAKAQGQTLLERMSSTKEKTHSSVDTKACWDSHKTKDAWKTSKKLQTWRCLQVKDNYLTWIPKLVETVPRQKDTCKTSTGHRADQEVLTEREICCTERMACTAANNPQGRRKSDNASTNVLRNQRLRGSVEICDLVVQSPIRWVFVKEASATFGFAED